MSYKSTDTEKEKVRKDQKELYIFEVGYNNVQYWRGIPHWRGY